MSWQKQLKVFTLTYDNCTNSISPGVAYLNLADTLRDIYKIIGCCCVTCMGIEINGKNMMVGAMMKLCSLITPCRIFSLMMIT